MNSIIQCLVYTQVIQTYLHRDGGFVDGRGRVVVHSAAVAIWKLGPPRESTESEYDRNQVLLKMFMFIVMMERERI